MGIEELSKNSIVLRIFVQDILNLPLIPAKYMIIMYNILKEELINGNHTMKINEVDVPLVLILNPFFQYFERFWLKIVTPDRLSVYDSHFRTNNTLERFHRDLHGYLGTRPELAYFLDNLVKIQKDKHIGYLAAERNGTAKVKLTPEAKVFNDRLQSATRVLKPYLSNLDELPEMKLLKLREFLTTLRSASDDVHDVVSQLVDQGI